MNEHRIKINFAHFVDKVVADYPEAENIVVVWDNLNTHKKGSLHETFDPAKPRVLANKLEIH